MLDRFSGPDFKRIANRGSPWRKYFWKTALLFPGARFLQGLRTGGHPDGNLFEKRHPFSRGPAKTPLSKVDSCKFFHRLPVPGFTGLNHEKTLFWGPPSEKTPFWTGLLGGVMAQSCPPIHASPPADHSKRVFFQKGSPKECFFMVKPCKSRYGRSVIKNLRIHFRKWSFSGPLEIPTIQGEKSQPWFGRKNTFSEQKCKNEFLGS